MFHNFTCLIVMFTNDTKQKPELRKLGKKMNGTFRDDNISSFNKFIKG